MTTAKNILLARPHGFIVSEMRPFLEKAGYAAIKLESLADLDTCREPLAGAIISTAVVSSVSPTPEAVFAAMKGAVERIVKALHGASEILPIAADAERHAGLGRESVFLVLRKEDLVAGNAAALTERVVRRHFR